MTPAVPPLPTIWNFPFQPVLGIHTSNCTAGKVTPTTRQIGTGSVPTGFGFAPAGRSSASVIVVSGMLTAALRSAHATGCAAAAGRAIRNKPRNIAPCFFILVSLVVVVAVEPAERIAEPSLLAGEARRAIGIALAVVHRDLGIRAQGARALHARA